MSSPVTVCATHLALSDFGNQGWQSIRSLDEFRYFVLLVSPVVKVENEYVGFPAINAWMGREEIEDVLTHHSDSTLS